MSLVLISGDKTSIIATKSGNSCVIPKALGNADYMDALGVSGKVIARQNSVYNAFPAMVKIGSSLIGIYSSGAGHGNSDRQIMVRSDDSGATWTSATFYENAGAVYNNTLLNGLMATGDKIGLKTWTIEKTVGGYNNTIVSTVANGGITYALWTNDMIDIGGVKYKTGYGTNAGFTQTALFKSTNGGVTWTFVSIMAAHAARNYSEAGLCRCTNGDLFAVVRQDGFSSTRPLWWIRSTDGGLTWTAPVQYDPGDINGVQPYLFTLANGDVILMAGDRVGFSGINGNGLTSTAEGITGISAWRSSDHGVTFTSRSMIAPMWSTDGGQPAPVQLANGNVGFLCYLAPAPTDGTNGVEPEVWFLSFNPNSLV